MRILKLRKSQRRFKMMSSRPKRRYPKKWFPIKNHLPSNL